MEKPSNLLLKLSRRLFGDSSEQERLIQALIHPKLSRHCIIWCQNKPTVLPFSVENATPWQPPFVDCLSVGEKPGQHPLHESGYYYCLDFSSIFAASTFLTIPSPVYSVLDMCAAPGGKSIFAWRALRPELLICNEVIGKRTGMLISNLKRCHISPSIVLSTDSSILAQLIRGTSNLVIVDAPCTGQSLLAKGGKAPGCFHPNLINKNANRQKRIIANSAQIVAPQGYLAYMTCTYSLEENEQVCEWFLAKFSQFQPIVIPHLAAYQSHLSNIPCYRMWPQNGQGAGAFTVLFKNTIDGKQNQLNPDDLTQHGLVSKISA